MSSINPKIVTDGLAFMYDIGSGKSYKGEPTENIFLNPTFIGTSGTQTSAVTDNWFFSGYTGDSGFKFYNNSTSPFSLKFPNEGSLITTGANDDSTTENRRFYCDEGLQAGATYTVSAWIYTTRTSGLTIAHFEYGGSSLNNGYFSGTSTHPNHVLGEWYYWEDTYTVGADYTSGLIGPVHTGSSDTIVGIQRFQIEKKSHATPFVNGTRSATQGLLDLTNTTTINISSASFDSNAQMTFDGTDDYISLDATTDIQAQAVDWTWECWFYVDADASSYDYLFAYGPPHQIAWYNNQLNAWFNDIDGTSSYNVEFSSGSNTVPTGQWTHGVISRIGSSWKMYINGVEKASASASFTVANSSTAPKIGSYDGSQHFLDGKIASMRIYKGKGFTAEEVLQNYNAMRGRFGV